MIELGVSKDDIQIVIDEEATEDYIDEILSDFVTQVNKQKKAIKPNEKTLIVIYFSGHGFVSSQGDTLVYLPGDGTHYRLENKLHEINSSPNFKNSFVLGIFDCCRVRLPEIEAKGPSTSFHPS